MLKEKLAPILAVADILCEAECRVRGLELRDHYADIIIVDYLIRASVLVKIAEITDYSVISDKFEDTNMLIIRIKYVQSELQF